MARTVVKNHLVAKKFAQAKQSTATNSNRSLHFSSKDVLYSYRMPIAWRNQHGVFVVRSDSPSVTTTQHISRIRSYASQARECHDYVCNVDISELEDYGFDQNHIVGDKRFASVRHLYLRKDGKDYTLTYLGQVHKNTHFMVRNLPGDHLLFAGFIGATLDEILLEALPDEYTMNAIDGWVVWLGPFFLVPRPGINISDPDNLGESVLPRHWSAHEKAGKYARGIFRYRGKIMFSMNVDYHFSAMDTWMEIVPSNIWISDDQTLGDPAKNAIYTALPRREIDA